MSSAHDYELNINGTRLGRGQSFDYVSETLYQGWDITEALGSETSIAVGVLSRWYGNGQGRSGSSQNAHGLLAKVIIYYEDGSTQTITTDDTWVTATTPLSGTTSRNGEGDYVEEYNAQLERDGWNTVGYNTSGWTPAKVLGSHPNTTFTSLTAELGHVTEEVINPESISKLDDGTTIVDFGRVIPARITVHFDNGVAGTKLELQTGYELTSAGKIDTSSSATQSTDMRFIYTQKAGEQTYSSWDHLGFRYLQIPASAGEDFSIDDIFATAYYAETPEGMDSTLDTSNDMLNAVYDLMKYSSIYSAQNQFVDTPTREKGQFLQDSVNISKATTTTWYERSTTRKAIIQFLHSADRYWNSGDNLGRYNAVYPNGDGQRDIPDFTLNLPTWVWNYYMQTGDTELLDYAYPYLQETANYASRYIAANGLVTQLAGGTSSYLYGIIDWPSAGRFGYDTSATARTTVNALSVRLFDNLALIAEELEDSNSVVQDYKDRAEDLRDAMNANLITANGVYSDGLLSTGSQSSHESQHATSYALAFDIAPEEYVETMAEYVASLGMKQGPMTADILVEALFDAGMGEAAYELLINTEDYGWAKLVNEGYTFTWESWQYGESQSHGWGAAAVADVLENIAGVTVTEAGASKVTIDPTQDILDSMNSSVVTSRGAVEVSYTGSDEDYELTVTVPVNMEAEVVLPLLDAGIFTEDSNQAVRSDEITGTTQIITVGSGTYTFSLDVENPSAPSEPTEVKAEAGDGIVKLTWAAPANNAGSKITTYEIKIDDGQWIDLGLVNSYTLIGLTNDTEYTFTIRAINKFGNGDEAQVSATPSADSVLNETTSEFIDPSTYVLASLGHYISVTDGAKGSDLIAEILEPSGPARSYSFTDADGTAISADELLNDLDVLVVTSGSSVTEYTIRVIPNDEASVYYHLSSMYETDSTQFSFGTYDETKNGVPILSSASVTKNNPVDYLGITGTISQVAGDYLAVDITVDETGYYDLASFEAKSGSNRGAFKIIVVDDNGDEVNFGTVDTYSTSTANVITTYDKSSFTGGSGEVAYLLAGKTYQLRIVFAQGQATGTVHGTIVGVTLERDIEKEIYDTVPQVVDGINNITIDSANSTITVPAGITEQGLIDAIDHNANYQMYQVTDKNDLPVYGENNLYDGYTLRVMVSDGSYVDYTISIDTATLYVPSLPLNLNAEPGDGQVTLTWTKPENDGGIEDISYQVSTDGVNWTDVNGTTYTATGLTNGTEYTLYVRSVNAVGEGDAATVKATPVAIADAPQNLSATPGDSEVILNWNAPVSNGGSDITKYQVSTDVVNWTDVTGTTYTVTGLTNGTEYTFYVRAANSVGEGEAVTVKATPVATAVEPDTPSSTTSTTSNTVKGNAPKTGDGVNFILPIVLVFGSVIGTALVLWKRKKGIERK